MSNNDFLCVCDLSGFVFHRSECRLTWDGKLVYYKYWEPRQPQDLIRARRDDQSIVDARPDQEDPPLLDPPIDASDVI